MELNISADFNNIGPWLKPQLLARNLSIEEFANACGLSRASIYFYTVDRARPREQAMIKMCQVLGVPAEEGLRQYTPRKAGRPGAKPHA